MTITNFLFKELVNTFDYTTANKERGVWKDVSINGRNYITYGTLQAVTFVGNVYQIKGGEGHIKGEYPETQNKYVLVVGLARQHPCEVKITKEEGLEMATINAMNDPAIIMEVPKNFNYRSFVHIVESYIHTMNLKMLKTKSEIEASGDDPKKYNR